MGMGHVPQDPPRAKGAGAQFQRRQHRRAAQRKPLARAGDRTAVARANQAFARFAEDLVVAWYVREGYEIIARNWRCTRGELDIVAWRNGVLAVCEVKARRNADFADPFEAITPHKMQRVRRATAAYIASLRDVRAGATAPHNLTVPTHIREIRFDAAAVVGARVEVRENVA